MINGLRLKNIRSLVDTGKVEFRPITLLLGQNSSGKSTFLRSLPLIKQSIRTRSNAPVLWYGDFVDFGSMKEVRSTLTTSDIVELEFFSHSLRFSPSPHYYYYYPAEGSPTLPNARLRIELVEHEEATRLTAFEVGIADDVVQISVDGRGVVRSAVVNGRDYSKSFPADKFRFIGSELVPQLVGTTRTSRKAAHFYRLAGEGTGLGYREIIEFLAPHLPRTSQGTIRQLAYKIVYAPGDDFPHRLRAVTSSLRSWSRFVKDMTKSVNSKALDDFRSMYLLAYLPNILGSFQNSITNDFADLAYVGPSRATGERYYRHQELAVDQIDPQGQNLAMFLYSLPSSQKELFSKWLEKMFGYEIKLLRSAGHMQIELRESHGGTFHNLADMGYGFSQVLPVLAQVWAKEIRERGSLSPFVTVEQPELHLHPAYQARLADILAGAVTVGAAGPRRALTFVVETHSESLVNRLGELVYQKKLPPDAVTIYVFENGPSGSSIRRADFDENGSLLNWPLGFFSSSI